MRAYLHLDQVRCNKLTKISDTPRPIWVVEFGIDGGMYNTIDYTQKILADGLGLVRRYWENRLTTCLTPTKVTVIQNTAVNRYITPEVDIEINKFYNIVVLNYLPSKIPHRLGFRLQAAERSTKPKTGGLSDDRVSVFFEDVPRAFKVPEGFRCFIKYRTFD